ncbi:hypothetical protein, partial [Actinotignum sp. GS-2025b]|uniref:hypothetical protein n=1 Tax=Actinotignum sp. GS-2025b TaxID=3427275 RepID=UPI003F4461BF
RCPWPTLTGLISIYKQCSHTNNLTHSADKAEAKMKRLEQRREKELAAKDAEIARLEKASEVLARAVVSAYLFSEKHGNG